MNLYPESNCAIWMCNLLRWFYHFVIFTRPGRSTLLNGGLIISYMVTDSAMIWWWIVDMSICWSGTHYYRVDIWHTWVELSDLILNRQTHSGFGFVSASEVMWCIFWLIIVLFFWMFYRIHRCLKTLHLFKWNAAFDDFNWTLHQKMLPMR